MIDYCRLTGYNSCLNLNFVGQDPCGPDSFCNGAVAQLGERLNGIQEVASSILAGSILIVDIQSIME